MEKEPKRKEIDSRLLQIAQADAHTDAARDIAARHAQPGAMDQGIAAVVRDLRSLRNRWHEADALKEELENNLSDTESDS